MGTCKTCRFYLDADRDYSRYANVKKCACPKIIFGVSKLVEDDAAEDDYRQMVSKKDGHVIAGDEAAVVDGSDYAGWLMPAPDFGCVHHQPVIVGSHDGRTNNAGQIAVQNVC